MTVPTVGELSCFLDVGAAMEQNWQIPMPSWTPALSFQYDNRNTLLLLGLHVCAEGGGAVDCAHPPFHKILEGRWRKGSGSTHPDF